VRQILVLLLLAAPARARSSSITPEMDRILLDGLDAVYRMDFPAADEDARRAIALQPDYPFAYLGRAATELIRYCYGTEMGDQSLVPSFEAKIAETIRVSDAWLKLHPGDPDVLFVQGAAHGVAGRMAIERRQWLKAFSHGRAAMKSIRAASAAAPDMFDAQLGLGMFDYYVDTIPRFVGWLAKIMLGGSRERGLREIAAAAAKGRYAKTAAQLILVEIYTEDDFGGRNPPEALRLMTEICAQYPGSPMLEAARIVALYENRELDEAVAASRAFLKNVESGRFPALDLAKAHALLGTLLWARGDRDEALEHFRVGGAATGDAERTRWCAWSRVREGQLLDALGRRPEALAAYRAAAALPDNWDFRAIVKPCLSAPCVGAKYPGHFSPY
jgi:tetratricopeptide (TPR) repeat protein